MGRVDSAFTALVAAGIAMAVGGAGLFGIVAHTMTPMPKVAGTAPGHSVAPSEVAAKSAELTHQRRVPTVVPAEPHPEVQIVEAGAARTLPAEALPPPSFVGPVPRESLSPDESVVVLDAERSAPAVQTAQAAPVEVNRVETRLVETKPLEIKPVETKVAEPVRVETWLPEAKSNARHVETRVATMKVAPAKPVEPKRAEPKAAPSRIVEAKHVEPKSVGPKPAGPKLAEATRVWPKLAAPVAPKVVDAKHVQPKRAEVRRTETMLVQAKPVDSRHAQTKRVALAETKRAPDVKATAAKLAETKRAAEMKAAETKLAETKRAAETMAAEAKLAEMKRAAEAMAAEAKLAETKRVADMKAAEAKLAETKRAAEAMAAEAKLAETRAETKLAEARLAETIRAVEISTAEARPSIRPAAETRYLEPRSGSASQRYACDTCGTVTSVVTRLMYDGTNVWDVRVNFGSGTFQVFRYPTNPGLWSGERVRYEAGRLMRM